MRLQGTDGVRRHVMLSTAPELSGLTPQQAFIERDVITEQFMELYTYCRARSLIESGLMKQGERIVVGWDPRDTSGVFTESAVRGLLKGGANASVIGVMPTPAVAVYMRATGAAGGIVITASHNPASYNGIKIFTRSGLKLLPGDDIKLSARVMETDYGEICKAPVTGVMTDDGKDALDTFVRFSLDPRNSWINERDKLRSVTLIVDAANGALSPVVESVLELAGFGKVIYVNRKTDGSVNVRSGVAELEGAREITAPMAGEGGRFHNNEAIKTLFQAGRENAVAIKAGRMTVSAAVFDGDGDRFYRVDYDPFTDSLFLLSGDETAILQARHRRMSDEGKLFVNTIESDLNAAVSAMKMRYGTELTSVGDKWILLTAILSAVKPAVGRSAWDRIEKAACSDTPSADAIEKILSGEDAELAAPEDCSFSVGGEESGHNITPGVIDTEDGPVTVFAGNGLKSCLNTFAATESGKAELWPVEERVKYLKHPFQGGYKKTMYVYHVDKSAWRRESPLWSLVKKTIFMVVEEFWADAVVDEVVRPEDADTLYIKILESGAHTCSVFVRNSGTEDKTGVSLRGDVRHQDRLLKTGDAVARILLSKMKDMSKPMAKAERELVLRAGEGGAPSAPVGGLSHDDYERLLVESGIKQGLLTGTAPGAMLTKLGEWYFSCLKQEG